MVICAFVPQKTVKAPLNAALSALFFHLRIGGILSISGAYFISPLHAPTNAITQITNTPTPRILPMELSPRIPLSVPVTIPAIQRIRDWLRWKRR